jgi:hypothetical protein
MTRVRLRESSQGVLNLYHIQGAGTSGKCLELQLRHWGEGERPRGVGGLAGDVALGARWGGKGSLVESRVRRAHDTETRPAWRVRAGKRARRRQRRWTGQGMGRRTRTAPRSRGSPNCATSGRTPGPPRASGWPRSRVTSPPVPSRLTRSPAKAALLGTGLLKRSVAWTRSSAHSLVTPSTRVAEWHS